jgi:uncharacterized damage-inducible protein DinB
MALSNRDFIEGLRSSRRHFLKHLAGLKPQQIEWKPFPECKSVKEILAHLVVDDLAALESFQTLHEPGYDKIAAPEGTYEELRGALDESHEKLISWLNANLADKPLDESSCGFGHPLPACQAIAHISSEDYYHAGQIAFIRMATDPEWEYYGAIYGE